MALIGQYKKKIKSAKNIAKLTRAMQLVAASKMKKAQAMAEAGKDYALGLTDLSHLLSSFAGEEMHPLMKEVESTSPNTLYLLIAPEKGLCGGLIANLTRFIAHEVVGKSSKCDFVTVGSKARQIARKLGVNVIAEFALGLSYPKYEAVPAISKVVRDSFALGKSDVVKIVYSDFINTMVQIPKIKTLLPLKLATESGEKVADAVAPGEYLFEPTPGDIIASLLEMYLEVEIYQLMLDAYASEQSARMVAMKNATDNASGLIDSLTVEYNKVRQAGITNEILDIGNAGMILNA